jgi:citrate synthase
VRRHTLIKEDVKRFYDGFPKDAHPMAILSSVVSALSTFYQDSEDPHDPEQVQLLILRLMAKIPTIAAYAYKKSIGQPFLYPNNELDLIENFLTMMFAVPRAVRGEPDGRARLEAAACTPTTSRTAPRRRSGSSARARPTSGLR